MNTSSRLSILRELSTSETGLSNEEVGRIRSVEGFNEIPEQRSSLLALFFSQFQDTMVYILLAAVAVSAIVPFLEHGKFEQEELINASVILAIVFINAVLGFAQEWRAENAIALLKKLSAPNVKVRREGVLKIVPARELVSGDIFLVEAGDRVSADARLIATSSLEVDEASLTGESVPVAKLAEVNLKESHASPAMLYAATLVTRGFGEAVVTATALKSEIGKISSMVRSIKPPPTPLAIELKKTGQRIGVIVLAFCAGIFALGAVKGMPLIDIFFTAVSLAVAAVPEGLPAALTICLAIGTQRMMKKNALIRRLDAVETLGSITIICADKTGTMTQNRMAVEGLWLPSGQQQNLAIEIAASCNRAELPDIGDPTEVALLVKAEQEGIERLPIADEEVPFTSEAKYMVTLHEKDGKTVRYLKGAPEVIARFLPANDRALILAEAEKFSKAGLRVLAVASGTDGSISCAGLVALMDPPRPGVASAIVEAKQAGIRTMMITGDHPSTALAIARNVGLETDGVIDGEQLEQMDREDLQHAMKRTAVFARVQPKHKVKILEALQALGHVVAMSGDGVNDAPALKRAHVGIAMGLKGTDIARESGAMVLTDDNYATIVSAIAEGRRIYDNVRKFVLFLMRCNVGEVMTIAGAMLLGFPLPLLPLQILWINLVTDSFPALALAMEPAEEGIMQRKPRKSADTIFSGEWTLMLSAGALNMIVSLFVFRFTLSQFPENLTLARTATLTTTILFQMLLALSTRTRSNVFASSPFKNSWLMVAIAASLLAHVLLLTTPLSMFFFVTKLPFVLLGKIAGAAVVGFLAFECVKWIKGKSIEA